jgi:hypothetical protein
MKTIYSKILKIKASIFILMFAFSFNANAVTITVTNTNDSGVGSLRSAVTSAVHNDIVTFSQSLISGGSSTIVLNSMISFNQGITIKGIYNQNDTLFISGNNSTVLFAPSNVGSSFNEVIFDSLVLINSDGAIHALNSEVFVLNSILRNNTALKGAAIYSYSSGYSYVTVNNSSIYNNVAVNYGGGIYCEGYKSSTGNAYATVVVENSTLYNNDAGSGGSAIYSRGYRSTFQSGYATSSVQIRQSTICNNSGLTAIRSVGNTSGNSASRSRSMVNVENSTIANNEGIGISSSKDGFGSDSWSRIFLTSSIVALNGVVNISNSSSIKIISSGYNALSDATINGSVALDYLNIDSTALNLGSLSFNGGTTKTVIPLLGSIALDNGNPVDAVAAQNTSIIGVRDVGAAEHFVTSTYSTETIVACESYTWNGILYTVSNYTAKDTLVNTAGFDSIISLNLTINEPVLTTDVQVACDSYTWINGMTYTGSNTTDTHTILGGASTGCDSIITLDLTLNNSTIGTDVQIACESYTWIDGITYIGDNSTATYTIIGGTVTGCDSIVTLNLIINTPAYGTDTQIACESYTWIDGNTYTSDNMFSTYTFLGGSVNGCDSVVTLNLTITNSTSAVDTQLACNDYTWIDGLTYIASNNTATFMLTNVNNCDSLVTLDLTINALDITTTINADTIMANVDGATYQWLDCDNNNAPLIGETEQYFLMTVNGNFAVEITKNGCSDISECVNVADVGIQNSEFTIQNVSLYPNPTTGKVTIDLGKEFENLNIELTDVNGRLLISESENKSQLITLDIDRPKGIYFLKISSDKQYYVTKIIKH